MSTNEVNVKEIDEVPHYDGPGAIAGIKFHSAARALGVTAWGMNVIAIEPGVTAYPEHDHLGDGQEEVYVVLSGSATLKVGDEEWPLAAGSLARVGPAANRKILPGPDGVTLLAIGATPGKAYEPRR